MFALDNQALNYCFPYADILPHTKCFTKGNIHNTMYVLIN